MNEIDKTNFRPGRYMAKVTWQAMSESSNGNPQLILKFMPTGMIRENDTENLEVCYELEQTVWITFTEKSMDFAAEQLAAIGFTGNSFRQLDPQILGHQSFVGDMIQVFCEHNVWEGTKRDRWGVVTTASAPKPIATEKYSKLDAIFGKYLKRKAEDPKAAVAEMQKDIEAVADKPPADEIPF